MYFVFKHNYKAGASNQLVYNIQMYGWLTNSDKWSARIFLKVHISFPFPGEQYIVLHIFIHIPLQTFSILAQLLRNVFPPLSIMHIYISIHLIHHTQCTEFCFTHYTAHLFSWSTLSKLIKNVSTWWDWKIMAGRRRRVRIPLPPTMIPTIISNINNRNLKVSTIFCTRYY